MGVSPIAIGVGPTAASRRPLGAAVLGGLLFSQFLTLYITPVFYTYMESFQEWLRSRRAAAPPEPSAPGVPAAEQPHRRIA